MTRFALRGTGGELHNEVEFYDFIRTFIFTSSIGS
jgi:hypothetical protein